MATKKQNEVIAEVGTKEETLKSSAKKTKKSTKKDADIYFFKK